VTSPFPEPTYEPSESELDLIRQMPCLFGCAECDESVGTFDEVILHCAEFHANQEHNFIRVLEAGGYQA
jgi:hypothetical protein